MGPLDQAASLLSGDHRKWPRRCCTTSQRDELAPPHSITSTAIGRRVTGISSWRPLYADGFALWNVFTVPIRPKAPVGGIWKSSSEQKNHYRDSGA